MSSEMRELVEKWRKKAHEAELESASYIEQGDQAESRVWEEECAVFSRCADELEALLARTEAGADGYDDGTRRVRDWRGSDTHPQDASGDAEDAAMFRWLCDNARPWESDYEQPHALIRICRGEFQGGVGWFNIIGRESRVGVITLRDAVRCAMQAKEAK